MTTQIETNYNASSDKAFIMDFVGKSKKPVSKSVVLVHMSSEYNAGHETTGRRLRELAADGFLLRQDLPNGLHYLRIAA